MHVERNLDQATPNSRNRLKLLELRRTGISNEAVEQEVNRHELGNQTGRISEVVLNLPLNLNEGRHKPKAEITALDWMLSQEVAAAFSDRVVTVTVPKPDAYNEPVTRESLEQHRRQHLGGETSPVRFMYAKQTVPTTRWARDFAFPNANGFGLHFPSRYETYNYNVNQNFARSLQSEVTGGGQEIPFSMEGGNTIVHDGTVHVSSYTIHQNAERFRATPKEVRAAMEAWFKQPVVILDELSPETNQSHHLDLVYSPLAPGLVAVADLDLVTTALKDYIQSTQWEQLVREHTLAVIAAYDQKLPSGVKLDQIRDMILSYATALSMQYADGNMDELGRAQQARFNAIAEAAEARGNKVIRLPYIPSTDASALVTYNNGLADGGRYVVANFGKVAEGGRETIYDVLDELANAQLRKAGVTPIAISSAGLPHTAMGGSLRCRSITFHEQP